MIISDHGCGSVSENPTNLESAALSDPYLAYSAGINSLCDSIQGLNNKRALKWVLKLHVL